MRTHSRSTILAAIVAASTLVLGACGDDDTSTTAGDTSDAAETDGEDTGDTTDTSDTGDAAESDGGDTDDGSPETESGAGDPMSDAEEMAEGMVDDLTDLQEAQGGGSATLTVGDQEWTFSSVLCAFGEEQIGQEGAEFVLSSIQDGLQLYASIDSFGNSISLDDVEDFQNPSVSLSAFADATITLDGTNVTGEGGFMDGTSDSIDTTPGTLTATCP